MDEPIRPNKVRMPEPLTHAKVNRDIEQRIEHINKEFVAGFDKIKTQSKSVTFFGSARTLPETWDYQMARKLAQEIVNKLDYTIITGGGPGIMEAANRGAFESGGRSYGLTIRLPVEQITNKYLTDQIAFEYFFIRKVCLTYSAESFVFFPGGFGTMDECFEILTLIQTNKIPRVPVILFNKKYWGKFDKFIKEQLLKKDKIDPEDMNIYTIVDKVEHAMEIIKKAPLLN